MLPTASPERLVGRVVFFFGQREQSASVADIRCRGCGFDCVGRVCPIRTIHRIEFPTFENDETFYGVVSGTLKEVRLSAVTKLLLGPPKPGQLG
jgi:hypothetical protein